MKTIIVSSPKLKDVLKESYRAPNKEELQSERAWLADTAF